MCRIQSCGITPVWCMATRTVPMARTSQSERMTLESATTFVDILFAGMCLFCASQLFMRQRDPGVYLPLALLFLFQGMSSLIYLQVDTALDQGELEPRITIAILLAGILDTANPFLFWLYVRGLTTEHEVQRIPKPARHIIPIVIISFLIGTLVFVPTGLGDVELPDDHPLMIRASLIVLAVLIADILFKILIATYLILIIRRLRTYNKRLKEVFASTENRELHWIWLIMICAGVYWLISVSVSVSIWVDLVNETQASKALDLLDSLTMLALFWVLGIWGLRQRPGLVRAPVTDPPEPDTPATQKYEKSALDDERAARIAGKIETAMSDDLLYRDPNLSLWDLAKHIGVTSHYVSQTLNTRLNSSFFDYINHWRIKDAVVQLTTTDETILVIAYDVGFNSRSAFYKAFKRETGKTPSDLRK